MALELIVVEGLFVTLIGSLLFAHISNLKIFYVLGFVLLAFTGIFVWVNDGVIVGHYYDIEGNLADITYSYDSPIVMLFVQLCFWAGLVLTMWSVFFTSMSQSSGNVKAFVWDN